MENQEQSTSTEQQTSTESSLDSVYKEFKVDDVAQTFQPKQETRQEAPVSKPAIPDPVLDAEGFKTWQAQTTQQTQQALQSLTSEQQATRQWLQNQKEEVAIKEAVSTFKSVMPEADDDLAEIALGYQARKDKRFASLYNNREANPRAWKAAVHAYATDYKAKNQFKTDGQLTENVRAAKTSTQTSQTTKEEMQGSSLDKAFDGKAGHEFKQLWDRALSSGY